MKSAENKSLIISRWVDSSIPAIKRLTDYSIKLLAYFFRQRFPLVFLKISILTNRIFKKSIAFLK